MRSLGWALAPCDRHAPKKRTLGHRHTQRGRGEKAAVRTPRSEASAVSPARWPLHPGPQPPEPQEDQHLSLKPTPGVPGDAGVADQHGYRPVPRAALPEGGRNHISSEEQRRMDKRSVRGHGPENPVGLVSQASATTKQRNDVSWPPGVPSSARGNGPAGQRGLHGDSRDLEERVRWPVFLRLGAQGRGPFLCSSGHRPHSILMPVVWPRAWTITTGWEQGTSCQSRGSRDFGPQGSDSPSQKLHAERRPVALWLPVALSGDRVSAEEARLARDTWYRGLHGGGSPLLGPRLWSWVSPS